MCRLFLEAGIIALTAFISPYREDRQMVRSIVGDEDFIEIFCNCKLEICESRDTKCHYARARRGEIPEFTGVSAPYEVPENPELVINTGNDSIDECVEKIINYLKGRDFMLSPK